MSGVLWGSRKALRQYQGGIKGRTGSSSGAFLPDSHASVGPSSALTGHGQGQRGWCEDSQVCELTGRGRSSRERSPLSIWGALETGSDLNSERGLDRLDLRTERSRGDRQASSTSVVLAGGPPSSRGCGRRGPHLQA